MSVTKESEHFLKALTVLLFWPIANTVRVQMNVCKIVHNSPYFLELQFLKLKYGNHISLSKAGIKNNL